MELFYYTTTDTMKYILMQGDIYATNIRYMNDSEEYLNGLNELYKLACNTKLVEKWIAKNKYDESLLGTIKNTFSRDNLEENKRNMEYYSISFCKENDLLSQWAIYAKEAGVSIKMDFKDSPYKFTSEGIDKDCEAMWQLSPQEVYYFTYESMRGKQDIYEEAAYRILDQLYTAQSSERLEWKRERWEYISALVKRYDFYQEEEYRLVFDPKESAYFPAIQYRHDKKVLKPYLDIYCDNGWPITEIMIGPGFNQQVVYDSVAHLLDHATVKVGVGSSQDYAKRLQSYLKPQSEYLDAYASYQELNGLCDGYLNNARLNKEEEEEAKILIDRKMDEVRKSIFKDEKCNENLSAYMDQRYFTRSGVVLTKSSIPYIF